MNQAQQLYPTQLLETAQARMATGTEGQAMQLRFGGGRRLYHSLRIEAIKNLGDK